MQNEILIKLDSGRAVVAVVRLDGEDRALEDIRPHQGSMPEVRHLLGARFPDTDALRRAVQASIRASAGDTMDNVVLSSEVCKEWDKVALGAAQRLHGLSIPVESIPDEAAKVLQDGALLIYMDLPPPIGRVSLRVEKGQWAWREGGQPH